MPYEVSSLALKRGSVPLLVIQAHRQIILKIFIRSSSGFLEPVSNSAISESPRVCQTHLISGFTLMLSSLFVNRRAGFPLASVWESTDLPPRLASIVGLIHIKAAFRCLSQSKTHMHGGKAKIDDPPLHRWLVDGSGHPLSIRQCEQEDEVIPARIQAAP